jgi:hypothetical protein
MPAKPLAFKSRDVERALRATQAAGMVPVSVEIDPKSGKIRIFGGKAEPKNDLDRELDEFARHG